MKLKKKIKFSDSNQVWRIKVTDTDKLFVETRDTEKMKAYYHCFELQSGKKMFTKHEMGELFWLGIEHIEGDVVYFHRYAKPDMPGHKGIFAFEITTQKILWEDEKFAFLFIDGNLIYVYQEGFEGRYYYTLDSKTGKIIEELGQISSEINVIREKAESAIDYSNYAFPDKYYGLSENSIVKKIIDNEMEGIEISGNVEYVVWDNLLLFNYHQVISKRVFTNKIKAYDLSSVKEIFSDILNNSANAYAPDSFFLYKKMVILLKEKKEIFVFEIKD